MILEKRSYLVLTLGIISITAIVPTFLSISVVEAGGKDDDNRDDDQLSERDIAVLCGATEDYEANKEQCDKLYNMLEEGVIKDDPNFEYD